MATKLQRLERVRLPQKPAAFNQTIIINNPNININYLAQAKGPLSSRGLDSWHLNNNLKQFSETRQLGFFKSKNNKNTSNSPYIIHKVRTHDIKSINKVYGSNAKDSLKETLSSFRKNQTLQHLPAGEGKQEQQNTTLQKISKQVIGKQERTTDRFYKANVRKMHKSELDRNLDTLPTTLLATQTSNPEARHPHSFRKNRFVSFGEAPPFFIDKNNETEDKMDGNDKIKVKEIDSSDSESQVKLQQKKVTPSRQISLSMRRHVFSKAIQNINLGLLGKTEGYLDHSYSQRTPQAQIQLFVNSLNHPEQHSEKDHHSQNVPNDWIDYDFHFDEERKKRPRTPKRKIPYQLDQ